MLHISEKRALRWLFDTKPDLQALERTVGKQVSQVNGPESSAGENEAASSRFILCSLGVAHPDSE
ncbi:MAG: hypothetical protein C3F11_10425 [Methylocystaceae bacterium]|nr:MAG: hypothetical protein C3F11_10425 [Methylocystaceae bacterium]